MDPTEDAIKSEIAAAVKILREDGVHIHKTYAQFQATLDKKEPPNPTDPPDPKEGDPPPPGDPKDPPKKKGIWWGDR
jgi:hypothetical protein